MRQVNADNIDGLLQDWFASPYPTQHSTQIFIKADAASGENITHFRMKNEGEWIPAPDWYVNRPRIALMDAEQWNQADTIAKYTLLLAKFFVPNIKAMMKQKRRFKWEDGVEITRFMLSPTSNTGFITVNTQCGEAELQSLMYKTFEQYPLVIKEHVEEEQLNLFGTPLTYGFVMS